MKSIRCSNLRLNGSSFLFVILACIPLTHGSPPCGLYGAPPCQFLPAPPGQTPKCARPGKTYCEHVDNYPTYLIKHLVHKWGYEAKNLLVDETWDDFAAVAWHETPVFYDPVSIFPQRNNYGGNGPDFNGYKYDTPSSTTNRYGNNRYLNNVDSSSTSGTYLLQAKNLQQKHAVDSPSSGGQRGNFNKHLGHEGSGNGGGAKSNPYFGSSNNLNVTPNNPTLWLKRIVRDLSEGISPANITTNTNTRTNAITKTNTRTSTRKQLSRDVSLNMDLLDIVGVEKKTKTRTKRQSPGRSTLCPTNSHFITPQAALNSRGNWMFVVNEANTARQMVKAELCSSNTCSNLCELPIGYNSRCEQKFVQKRLIALQGNGQNLYTDTFWFPSCCVCTISAT